jgi:hypothetical protein
MFVPESYTPVLADVFEKDGGRMKKEDYQMFRQAALLNSRGECISFIIRKLKLDYRTVRALVKIINNESGVLKDDINRYADFKYYTLDNAINLAERGLLDLIPSRFFSNSDFLRLTGIDYLPDMFMAGDMELPEFTVVPEIKHIGYGAFMDCTNLRKIEFGGPIGDISDNTFKNTEKLYSADIPDGCRIIGKRAFEKSGIRNISVPDSVTEIKAEAFKNCERLTDVYKAGNNPVNAGDECFANCRGLSNVDAVVGNVGRRAFSNCMSLKDVKLSASEIGEYSFASCIELERMDFIKRTPKLIGEGAFAGCVGLTHVISDGFSYELRECEGYDELTKMVRDNTRGNPDTAKVFEYGKTVSIIERVK